MSGPVIEVQEGKLRGKVKVDFHGNDFYSFQGIPYAKPPLGKLRFKAPQPPEKWEGIRDATENGNECYAKGNSFSRSEDCLFLNVYTKELQGDKLRPVMFWIHGGGFVMGSSHTTVYGPEYLMVHDVVLVTFNYRLGVLGFLCLEDTSLGVTGNAGLKDMVMALKWVQNNIKQFSGDPNNVTIFGESAGGVSVQLLMLSPITKGLFHKAIAQSGGALNIWARGRKAIAYDLANTFGIESNEDTVILEHLQNLSIEDLYHGSCKHRDVPCIGKLRPFGPVIEKPTGDSFLSEDPINLIRSGKYHKVPLITGYNSREGIFIYGTTSMRDPNNLLSDEYMVPYNLNLRIGSEQHKSVANDVKNFYFSDRDPMENIDDLLRVFTDNFFLLEIHNAAKLLLETGNTPLYFYRFSMDTALNFMKPLLAVEEPGACHGDDIAYLFKNGFCPEEIDLDTMEYIGIKRMTKLWTNFATYGNPTPNVEDDVLSISWQPAEIEKFNYLNIGEDLEMAVYPEKEAMEFWMNLYKKVSIHKAKL